MTQGHGGLQGKADSQRKAGVEIGCDIDIEYTADSFHAHAVPDGIDIRPGDVVMVHDMPDRVGFGERYTRRGSATLYRAGVLKRMWTEFAGVFDLAELYEVGFLPMSETVLTPHRVSRTRAAVPVMADAGAAQTGSGD